MLTLDDILSNPNRLFSVSDISQIFGLSTSALWNWINSKKIKATKVGNTWVFVGRDLIEYLDGQQTGDFKSVSSILKNRPANGE